MSTAQATNSDYDRTRMARDLRLDSIIRRHEGLLVTAVLAVVTLFALFYARVRLFWMDEFLTYDTATLGSPTAVWKSLHTLPLSVGPPLYHVLLQYWLRALPATEFAARLPSVLAYTLMCFFLYRFVHKYMDIYAGLIALLLSLACGAFRYAHEARPYALVLAAVSMTLLCWAAIVEHRKNRALALLGMWAGIVIIVGSHWFGCLALVPLILGELVRSWQARKVDVAVWAVLTTGAATAAFYLPLVKAASAYRTFPWMGAQSWDAFDTFSVVLEPCLMPLAVLMIILLVVRFNSSVWPAHLQLDSIPTPVFTCVVSLALISFPGLVFGKLTTHVFLPRYVLFCTIGLLVLISGALDGMIGTSTVCRVLAFLTIAICVLVVRIHDARAEVIRTNSQLSSLADLTVFSQQPSIPIVLTDDESTFLRIQAYGSPSLRRRCVCVTDSSVPSISGQNTIYLSIEALRLWTRDPISDLRSFLKSHDQFYFVTSGLAPKSWMIQRMFEAHAEISPQGAFGGDEVFLISLRH